MSLNPRNPEEVLRTFDRSLPMALLRAREAVMKKFVPFLREHDLSAQQWRVLRALYNSNGLEMTEISQQCFLLMPSLSRIVQNLQKRDLIQRQVIPEDQRRSRLSLTPKARALVELVAPESEQQYAHITEVFGYGKLELLYELLEELVDKLEIAEQQSRG